MRGIDPSCSLHLHVAYICAIGLVV